MALISCKTWPLIDVEVVGDRGHDLLQATLGALAGGLQRGAPFAVIVMLDAAAARAHAYRHGAGVDPRELRSVRGALRARCRAIAYVMTTELLAGHTRALSAAQSAFACPAESFGSSAGARAWAHGRLARATPVPSHPGADPRSRA